MHRPVAPSIAKIPKGGNVKRSEEKEIHQYLESSIVGIYFNSSMVMISSVKPCEMNPKPTDPSQSVKTNWMKSACEDAPQLKSPWLEPTEAQMKFNKNNRNQLNFCHLFQFHEKALVKTISKESTSTRICDDCQRLSQFIGRSTFLQGCPITFSVKEVRREYKQKTWDGKEPEGDNRGRKRKLFNEDWWEEACCSSK